MIEREILIANTKTQKKCKLMTSAENLGELKAAMTQEGIDYSGLTFTEGITKTQLLDDSSPLPKDVMFKGQPTNNLVILLTNTKKEIASGFGTRREAYNIIKDREEFKEGIQEEYGYNYTNVSTEDLWEYINNHMELLDEEEGEDAVSFLVNALGCILQALKEKKAISNEELQDVADIAMSLIDEDTEDDSNFKSTDGTITGEDINEMIDSIS